MASVLVIQLGKKNHMVHYILIAFTVATPIRGSALVEKLQNKSEFSYGQTVTVLLHGFL